LAMAAPACQNTEAQNITSDAKNVAPKAEAAKVEAEKIEKTEAINKAAAKPEIIHIGAVGDIMMGSNYPSASSLPPNDGQEVLADLREYLAKPDIMFGNLEGVLLDKGGTPKACGDSKNCYTFRMPQSYAQILKDYGFDVLSVANNHASDFGDGGRVSTAKTLEAIGMPFAGSIEHPTTTFEKDGIKYGFLAVAPNRGCVELKEYDKTAARVRELKKTCDIVIVSFHGGAEGEAFRHTPCKDEVYLGANRGNVCKLAHTCIDAGADVLLGHGPHVTRGVEIYKGRFIAYSMGNFCTYEKFGLSGNKGIGPIINININNKGEFIEGYIVPTRQHGKGIPKYDPTGAVIKEMISLSKADFPNSPLDISADGKMTIRK
jgi:hypothetical protein